MGDLSNEPSMEDILASIKKIIADDSGQKLSPPLERRPSARLAESDAAQTALDPQSHVNPSSDDDIFELEASHEEPAAPVVETTVTRPVRAEEPAPAGTLVSAAAEQASRSALSSLSRLIVKPETEGSDTLEGLVREMLKPMLKDWLDANLPAVVERVVTQEVARISGRNL